MHSRTFDGSFALINENLRFIQMLLSTLPKVIRGEVDDALFTTALGEGYGAAQDIHQYCQADVIDHNHSLMEIQLAALMRSLGAMDAIKGVTGMFVSSPLLAAWLCGTVALQKSKLKTIPGFKVSSPWSHQKMMQTRERVELFSQQAKDLHEHYLNDEIPGFPMHRDILIVKTSAAEARKYLVKKPRQDVATGDYRLLCPVSEGGPDRLQRCKAGPMPPIEAVWEYAHGPEADLLAGDVVTRRNDILTFLQFYPEYKAREQDLKRTFLEPIGIWNQ